MDYKNASQVLPDELLKEIQRYVSGEAIYIPSIEQKKKWGEDSGARAYYRQRNEKIRKSYKEGCSVELLAEEYMLTVDSIRKIVFKKKD